MRILQMKLLSTTKTYIRLILKKTHKIRNFLRRTVLKNFNQIKITYGKEVKIGKNVCIAKNVRFLNRNTRPLIIHDNTTICSFSKFSYIENMGSLEIGKGCILGEYGQYNIKGDLKIGNNVITSDRVSFITSTHYYKDVNISIKDQAGGCGFIEIGDDSWLAINSVILENVKLGKHTIVAANSVVKSGEYPDYCILAGSPAKIVKIYDFKTSQWIKYPH